MIVAQPQAEQEQQVGLVMVLAQEWVLMLYLTAASTPLRQRQPQQIHLQLYQATLLLSLSTEVLWVVELHGNGIREVVAGLTLIPALRFL